MTEFEACFLRLRRLGYDHSTAMRLAEWACDPSQPLYPENTK